MSSTMKKYYKSIQPNRGNFEFIGDEIEIKDYKTLSAKWRAKSDYWFFADHWPDRPLVPAVIQLEVIFQNLALLFFSNPRYKKEDYVLVTAIKQAKFLQQITPGMELNIKGEIIKSTRGIAQLSGEMHSKKSLVCSCKFDVYLEREYLKNSPKLLINEQKRVSS
jgi:3-hydroxyacyl-[acyl-carrier-protein] dehydratase